MSQKIPHEQIVQIKLNDKQMQENLMTAMHTLQKNRLNVIDARFKDWQGLRAKAKQAKNNALMSLEERLLEFEKKCYKKMALRCIGQVVMKMPVKSSMKS